VRSSVYIGPLPCIWRWLAENTSNYHVRTSTSYNAEYSSHSRIKSGSLVEKCIVTKQCDNFHKIARKIP
jgi:hypothetical protein